MIGNNQEELLIPRRRKTEFQQNMFIKSVDNVTLKGLENTLQDRIKIPKDLNGLGRYSYLKDYRVLYLAIRCQLFNSAMGKIRNFVILNVKIYFVKSCMSLNTICMLQKLVQI